MRAKLAPAHGATPLGWAKTLDLWIETGLLGGYLSYFTIVLLSWGDGIMWW